MVSSTTLQQFFLLCGITKCFWKSQCILPCTQTHTQPCILTPYADGYCVPQLVTGPLTVNTLDLFGRLGRMCLCVRVGAGKKALEVLEKTEFSNNKRVAYENKCTNCGWK